MPGSSGLPKYQPGATHCRCRRRARPREKQPRGSFFYFLFFLLFVHLSARSDASAVGRSVSWRLASRFASSAASQAAQVHELTCPPSCALTTCPASSSEQLTQPRKHQRSERVPACSHPCDTCTFLSPIPTLSYSCSPSLMGEAFKKRCTSGQTLTQNSTHVQRNFDTSEPPYTAPPRLTCSTSFSNQLLRFLGK